MLDGKITISVPHSNNKNSYILITIQDELSGARFLDIEMSLSDFAQCLTGLSRQNCKMEVRALDKVGKKKETLPFEFEIPDGLYHRDRENNAIKTGQSLCPDGWIMSTYFGSQSSFFTRNNKTYARTTISRWIEVDKD